MTHLLAIVVGVGLADSVNPTTVAPALYLAGGQHAVRSLGQFLAGFFVTNLAAGVLIALGPGKAIMSALPRPGGHALHLIEIAAGGVLIGAGIVLWLQRERVARHVTAGAARFDRSALLVGAGLAIVELPTAIPYLAIIAAVVGSGHGALTQVALLAIFNVCFLLPVLLILGACALGGRRASRYLVRMRGTIDRLLGLAAPVLVLLVGLALLGVGLAGLFL